MNPISHLTGAVIHPARTAGSVAGRTFGVASGGIRTAGRVIGWVAGQATGRPTADDTSPHPVPSDTAPSDMAPVEAVPTTTPATEAPATKAADKTAPAETEKPGPIRAPSAKAAVVAPARGVPEAEVVEDDDTDGRYDSDNPDTQPLIDPATAKAVASETAMMRKAADPKKG
jgi:hypothetical protein